MTVRVVTLANGLRLATENVPGALSVAAGVWVGVGSRDEPAELAGVSHFLEHLLFKGTETRSARDIAVSIDRVGGDMNAFTSKEYTAYYTRVPARELSLSLDLLGDVLSRPALRDADIETEREVILEELAMDDDQPDDVAYQLFSQAMFPGHSLGRETAGERETVEATSADHVRAFFADRYRAESMVLSVAGPIDHDAVRAVAEASFSGLRSGSAAHVRSGPGLTPAATVGEVREGEQSHTLVGVRGVDRFDPQREALDIVVHILGGGPSSRLFQTIREERGLAYSTYASSSCYCDAGAVSLYAGTTPSHAEEVLGLLQASVDALVRDGVTDDELSAAKGYLTGAYAMGFEGTSSRMDRLASQLITRGELRPIEEQLLRWERVEQPDVRRVIDHVFTGPRVVAQVGPAAP